MYGPFETERKGARSFLIGQLLLSLRPGLQLPSEGKKFAMVDKNWRQTISSAKSNNKVIDFCNSTKLLERFK